MGRLGGCASLAGMMLACAGPPADRDALLRSAFVRADASMLAQRPALTAGRYARMATSPTAFYRGSLPLFLRDWRDGAMDLSRSAFAVDAPMPIGVGDPHVENFGVLVARDGTAALEPNDLDAADRVPYLWDVRRLTIGLCLAAIASNADDPAARAAAGAAARDVAREAALSYAAAVQPGAPEARVTAGDGVPLLDDLFRRSRRDAERRAELDALTSVTAGARRLLRGAPDPADPSSALADLPSWALASLPDLLGRYRSTLRSPPDAAYFSILDAAREFGSGVASWPRVRVLVLLRGPTDAAADDVILEVKEQTDSVTPGGPPPTVYFDDIPSRVAAARGALWSRPDADALWGTATWLGLPVQIRTESEANKGVKIDRLNGSAGTPDGLRGLARVLGAVLGRAHRRSLPTPAPQAALLARAPAAFADEQVQDDWQRFRGLLDTAGPTLGFRPLAADEASSPARALFGAAP
jgi:uncharacterized protein (DUF2252 family)